MIKVIIIMSCVALLMVAGLIFAYIYTNRKPKEKKLKVEATNEKFEDVLGDLSVYVNYEVKNNYEKVLSPLIKKEKNNLRLINDEIMNELTVNITSDIMNYLSDAYIEKVAKVIKKENIESFIMKLIYDKLSELVMALNKETLKRLNNI